MTNKDVYVVLGMLRCGTSVVTRGLKALGIDLGNDLMGPNQQWNPKGYWEDNQIVRKITPAVVASANLNWHSLCWLDKNYRPDENQLAIKESAVKLLQDRFKHTDHWGFKEPNTAKILPFWQDVFAANNLNDHYVIVLRHPLSSANSYHQLTKNEINRIDVEHGVLLWATHMMAAIEGTQNKNAVVVSYDLLMQDPAHHLQRMKSALKIPLHTDNHEIDQYINGFLDKKLRHYHEQDGITAAMDIAPFCLNLYDLLLKAARDEIALDGEAFKIAWQTIQADYEKLMPYYAYLDRVLQQRYHLGIHMRRLRHSRLWKLSYPLRALDTFMRARKNKSRIWD